ncbi:MAG TPA: hypothetical protein VEH86_02825 [Candidatus Acidoferrum sp.]|nr:hypothetical protein [Candidatus Acidoferrum sp.]
MFILYIAIQYSEPRDLKMDSTQSKIREQIILAMLEEFPALKKKIRLYLEEEPRK